MPRDSLRSWRVTVMLGTWYGSYGVRGTGHTGYAVEHKKWVLDSAVGLRNAGVDALLDQWEIQAGDDLPAFMERNLSSAGRVLMICTNKYVEKANNGTGGVGYEKMIVTADLMNKIDSNKVIPIIRQNGTHDVPTFLKSKLFINLSSSE